MLPPPFHRETWFLLRPFVFWPETLISQLGGNTEFSTRLGNLRDLSRSGIDAKASGTNERMLSWVKLIVPYLFTYLRIYDNYKLEFLLHFHPSCIYHEGRGDAIRFGDMSGSDSFELSWITDLLKFVIPSATGFTTLLRVVSGGGGIPPKLFGSYFIIKTSHLHRADSVIFI